MKQRQKKKKVPKVRAMAVHEVMCAKVNAAGRHEVQKGRKTKRAKVKEQLRKELVD